MPSELMPPTLILLEQVEAPLVAAATEVLETMFFTLVESADQPAGRAPDVALGQDYGSAAEVLFHGAHGGRFRMVLSQSSVHAIAANFMGTLDSREIAPGQVEQVMCEFANMVCGATLSRLAPQEIFNLETPRLCVAPEGMPGGPPFETCAAALTRRLITDTGWIDLYWCWEAAA